MRGGKSSLPSKVDGYSTDYLTFKLQFFYPYNGLNIWNNDYHLLITHPTKHSWIISRLHSTLLWPYVVIIAVVNQQHCLIIFNCLCVLIFINISGITMFWKHCTEGVLQITKIWAHFLFSHCSVQFLSRLRQFHKVKKKKWRPHKMIQIIKMTLRDFASLSRFCLLRLDVQEAHSAYEVGLFFIVMKCILL